MKKYQVLLFDVDGTLLDFDKAEKIGLLQSPSLSSLRTVFPSVVL